MVWGTIVPRLLNFFLTPFYVRLFAPAQYGVVVEFYTYIAFVSIVLTLGLETGFFRFASKEKEKREQFFSAAFYSIFSISSFFLIAIFLFSDSISSSLGYSSSVFVINTALILFFDSIAAVPFAKLRLQNKPILFSFLKIFNVFFLIILNVLFLIIIPSFTTPYM